MKLVEVLRLENNQQFNTWFSNGAEGDGELQVNMTFELYKALGSPKQIEITINASPAKK